MSTTPNDDSALVGGAKNEQRARELRRKVYKLFVGRVPTMWCDEDMFTLFVSEFDAVAQEAREEGYARGAREMRERYESLLPLLAFTAVDSGRMMPGTERGCKSTPEKAAKYDADTSERADMVLARFVARHAMPLTGESAEQRIAQEEARLCNKPHGVEPHEFVGRLDRLCEVCGMPDRNEVHKIESAQPEQPRGCDSNPELREGDVWMVPCDVLVAVGDLAHVCITVENEEHCIALAADWLRANGRLLSRKGGA